MCGWMWISNEGFSIQFKRNRSGLVVGGLWSTEQDELEAEGIYLLRILVELQSFNMEDFNHFYYLRFRYVIGLQDDGNSQVVLTKCLNGS